MIAHRFLQWVRKAPAGERADATAALARAYLYSEIGPDDRAAMEQALIMLLDDASPLVRLAMARTLARSEHAPPAVIFSLADDQPEIAGWVLEHSPLLTDGDLVDTVATGGGQAQVAIAKRSSLSCGVSAALAEVGSAEACLVLVENQSTSILPVSLDRIATRLGHLAAIRHAMLEREGLPVPTHQALVAKTAQALAEFVAGRAWVDHERAQRATNEACEKATVALAAVSPNREIRPLIRHLRESGQLNAGLILRALLSGNAEFFLESLSELSDIPLSRVSTVVYGKSSSALSALFERAGLPRSTHPAFHEAVEAIRESGVVLAGTGKLKRRMVERVLTRCADEPSLDMTPLLLLLRRFSAEAAREEARLHCEELAEGPIERRLERLAA